MGKQAKARRVVKSSSEALDAVVKSSSEALDAVENVSTHSSEVGKMTLEEYLASHKVHPGLVASYRHEARSYPILLEPKTPEEWDSALFDQSKRQYS